MLHEELISANDFCMHHQIGFSFLQSLNEFGLIELSQEENNWFLRSTELASVERMVRLHYELSINLEGIDVIKNLLEQIENMNEEMAGLKTRLRFYEHG